MGKSTFSYTGAVAWNRLPASIKTIGSTNRSQGTAQKMADGQPEWAFQYCSFFLANVGVYISVFILCVCFLNNFILV